MNVYWIPLALVAMLVAANGILTVAVARSPTLDRRQRGLQVALVWLLPLLGPLLVAAVLWSDRHGPDAPRESVDSAAGVIGGTGDPGSYYH